MNKKNKQIFNHQNQKSKLLATQQTYSGPLPSPEAPAKYDQIIQGAAERILKMAEEQSAHRRSLESTVIRGNDKRANLGQIFGFLIGITGIVGGSFLSYLGKAAGFGTILLTLASLVGVYIYGKKKQESELKEKRTEQ